MISLHQNQTGDLKSNKRWIIASLVAGLLPISLDVFQSFIPEFIFLGSPVVAWALIIGLPIAICVLGVIKLYKWWKIIPVVLLMFNAVLVFLLIALIEWSQSYPY